jgi:hydroxymethylpyrimidine pyrophosphatase-like HAD family hydrolase
MKLFNLIFVSIKETMAFGDYLNDLEMMKQAPYSFAMENAHPDIKKQPALWQKAMMKTE